MMNQLFNPAVEQHKEKLAKAISSLLAVTQKIKHTELEQTVEDIKARIDDPFMFVIVGEVKAGKSSFINALLQSQKEICKVAPSPMTDTIQQIVYGEEESEEMINPFLKRITQPVEILKDIAIVDTPGTNTIVDHHQEITERFVPSSDLIIFVFESKNPYRQSAWQFFDFINEEWRKKIIFVLQQKDLMEPDDLVINIQGVKDHALQKNILDPKVFDVSAKMELEGKIEESGFKGIRAYIEKNITGGKAPFLKLGNIANTALNINGKISEGVQLRKQQFEADQKFRSEIKEILDNQEERTKRQITNLVENLVAAYDRITSKKEKDLKTGLGFFTLVKRSFSSMFGGGRKPKEWLDSLMKDFEYELNNTLKDKLQGGVMDIAESIQNMGKMVDIKIKNSETILKDNHEIFADIAERRANVLKDLQNTFSNFLSRSENFYDEELISDNSSVMPNVAAGSGIAIVGIIITAVTNGAVFDVTGGILTTIGLLFAGVTVGLKRNKIMKGFGEEIDKGRIKLSDEVDEKLSEYTVKIKEKIDSNFIQFDRLIDTEKDTLTFLETEQQRISDEITSVNQELTSHQV